ncbi:hypothetical protein [Rhizobium sp. Root1220]|uniref:hypothetical protein n=1 Tax=Rhizobium sp. Root1220 TaxID=1736432 RepID=UPI0006FC2100|nr:hypothetical protein [Rhizobium sp. Root1220]KQV82030.1 hypothetical protein ASC90_24270 [Rhizobium sp. Root1220]
MGILFGFLPFIGFALVDRLIGPTEGLIAGAAISIFILLRERMAGKTPKLLELGTAILFVCLAVYAVLLTPSWSLWTFRLLVDAGLLLIVLVSMAIGRPFTLQYARESVEPQFWGTPEFLRTNYIISAVWGLAFAAMVAADALLVFAPSLPQKVGIVVTILALVSAMKFTAWYPARDKSASTSSH